MVYKYFSCSYPLFCVIGIIHIHTAFNFCIKFTKRRERCEETEKAAVLSAVCAAALALGGCGTGSADGKTHLTFQIWDVAQRDGMQTMCDAYTEAHPDVEIEVQVTSWSEYWTKLEAAAISNQMPDIFWMHTNEILKYADYGKIADLTTCTTRRIPGISRSISPKCP